MTTPSRTSSSLPDVGVAVPAAGAGRRMGGRRKAFLELDGAPVLLRALRPFLRHPRVAAVTVALSVRELENPPRWLTGVDPRIRLVEGGSTRGGSVRAALEDLPETSRIVVVHDAARPLVTREIIDRCLEVVGPDQGAVAGWPAVDTLKEVDGEGRVTGTPDRNRVWHAQTPQVFPRELVMEAYRRAREAGRENTDDAALVEAVGGRVVMVSGSPYNLKVTRPEDLEVAELFLRHGYG